MVTDDEPIDSCICLPSRQTLIFTGISERFLFLEDSRMSPTEWHFLRIIKRLSGSRQFHLYGDLHEHTPTIANEHLKNVGNARVTLDPIKAYATTHRSTFLVRSTRLKSQAHNGGRFLSNSGNSRSHEL